MKTFRDAIIIFIVGIVLGFLINAIRTKASNTGLPLGTPWPDNRKVQVLDKPPSYQQGDSLLSLEDAYSIYLGGKAIFIDAREPEEYREAHIKGAVNFPFEQWDSFWDGVKPLLDPNKEIVAYCGGLDCELSLFSARELKQQGYPRAYVFFGGWLKWKEAGLPTSSE